MSESQTPTNDPTQGLNQGLRNTQISKTARLEEAFEKYEAYLQSHAAPTSAKQAYHAFSDQLRAVEESHGFKYTSEASSGSDGTVYFHEFTYDYENPYWFKVEDIHVFLAFKHIVALDDSGNLCFYERLPYSPSGSENELSIGRKIREFVRKNNKVDALSGFVIRDKSYFSRPHCHSRFYGNEKERNAAALRLMDARRSWSGSFSDYSIEFQNNYGINIEFREDVPLKERARILLKW